MGHKGNIDWNLEWEYKGLIAKGKRYTYIIGEEVRNEIKKISREETESGGFLLARRILDTNELVIGKFTKPIKEDKRLKSKFIPSFESIEQAERLANDEDWMVVGHWHTHPKHIKSSKPSKQDWKAFKHSMIFRSYFINYIVHIKSEDVLVYERPKEKLVCHKKIR